MILVVFVPFSRDILEQQLKLEMVFRGGDCFGGKSEEKTL
jgi:hypothetical protein